MLEVKLMTSPGVSRIVLIMKKNETPPAGMAIAQRYILKVIQSVTLTE